MFSSNLAGMFNNVSARIQSNDMPNFDALAKSLQEFTSELRDTTTNSSAQTTQYNSQGANQDFIRKLDELNTTMQQVAMHVAQGNNYGKEQLRATRSMTGNLFAGVG
jgi:flagellar biosynthesis/type III secretory pathway protein FliH